MNTKIEDAWQLLYDACSKGMSKEDLDEVIKAYKYAYKWLGDATMVNGEVIIIHSLEVALIVYKDIGLGKDSVVAGILHNIIYSKLPSRPDIIKIEKNFGKVVGDILIGMEKINAIGTEKVKSYAENYRKLMLTLAGDVRVILVEIADRLHVMRYLETFSSEDQKRLSDETTSLYAPLAHRLGLYNINSELLDIALKYLNPKAYDYVSDRLKESEKERETFVTTFVKPIQEKLLARGFSFYMKARTKSINSIWNKMQKKKVTFDEVYDIFAIRIILDSKPEMEKSDCWQVYSIVTEEYQANPERMRDWITVPKSNGYESLHATVLGPLGKWVEIQIRSKRMDEVAEKGLAAHWKYKGDNASADMGKWLANVREILENPSMNIVDFIDEFRTNVYKNELFVFTPKGELKRLPAGATLLDFAYEIHSQVGDHCIGGIANGKKVTLHHKLKNGEQISIHTSKNQTPKLDWLNFVITAKAKNRIKSSLNEEKKRMADNGKEMLERKLKNWKIEYNDEIIRTLLKYYHIKLAQDLYYNIFTEKIDPLEIKGILVKKEEPDSVRQTMEEVLSSDQLKELDFSSDDDYLVIDNNLK
ncbi:MAG: bifunctional (p)ppGpp synthetase/guanosine-3',5'-bis(diphosphate) 3'-pyrophosphohydrolase, partial [Prolixibacteraceae bacterium]|nr:bifunctional (p)ppGpp synthetase/guanosine-3',5'-bis(diphosphate) 3'-pyrophosphohydrolase [Prolixibacteraceae bacterium]